MCGICHRFCCCAPPRKERRGVFRVRHREVGPRDAVRGVEGKAEHKPPGALLPTTIYPPRVGQPTACPTLLLPRVGIGTGQDDARVGHLTPRPSTGPEDGALGRVQYNQRVVGSVHCVLRLQDGTIATCAGPRTANPKGSHFSALCAAAAQDGTIFTCRPHPGPRLHAEIVNVHVPAAWKEGDGRLMALTWYHESGTQAGWSGLRRTPSARHVRITRLALASPAPSPNATGLRRAVEGNRKRSIVHGRQSSRFRHLVCTYDAPTCGVQSDGLTEPRKSLTLWSRHRSSTGPAGRATIKKLPTFGIFYRSSTCPAERAAIRTCSSGNVSWTPHHSGFVLPEDSGPGSDLLTKKSGKMVRIGIFLDFASSPTRTPHGA